jgi:glycosyltransferase 2 family protein
MRKLAGHAYRIPSLSLASIFLALCGLAAVLWLLHENDYHAVLRIVTTVGGGLAIVVLLRGVILAACGLAWWCLLRHFSAPRIRVVIGFRTIAEAINVLLPVASVGGEIVRARLLTFRGVDGGAAAASTLVDLLLEATTQALFALIGIVLLLRVAGAAELRAWAAWGMGIAALALGGFYAVQRFGGARIVERALAALARRWPATTVGSRIRLDDSLQAIYANRPAVATASLLHELAWLTGALETWIALRLMGLPVSASTALILESLTQGLRGAAFPVPGGLGVQEGGYMALGAVFGIPTETALALSLVKRVPDLVIGLPGLLAWYFLQIQRLLPIRSGATTGGQPEIQVAEVGQPRTRGDTSIQPEGE